MFRGRGSGGWRCRGAVLPSALALSAAVLGAPAAASQPGESAFLDIYRELVETDTTLATGSCTAAATKMAARLEAAGFPHPDVTLFMGTGHPQEGGLVARFPSAARNSAAHLKALLLVAHIDVVDVRREDWSRDPFRLTEDGGYFYGRGVSDDKAMAAALVDSLIRLRADQVRLKRPVKIALTCGEETATAFNGVAYLTQVEHGLVDADLALIPTAGARLDASGKPVSLSIQAGEKLQANFQLEVTHAGGHSSRPVKNGAIARLARALVRLSDYDFPVELNDVTRRYFTRTAALESPSIGVAMRELAGAPAADVPTDAAAATLTDADAGWNAMLRTTCTTTLLQAGEAINALPRRAVATLNCRILPGHAVDEVQGTLVSVIADPTVTLTRQGADSPNPPPPHIDPEVLRLTEVIAARLWPGTAIIPTLLTGATDARHFNAAGIPAFGVTTVFSDPDGDGVHAANERVRVRSVYEGREFLYRLILAYANWRGH